MSHTAREPTRAQLSSRLQYAAPSTPAFLQRLKDRVAGVASSSTGPSSDFDDDFDQWEASSGREPIPRRPRDGEGDGDGETDEFGRARRPSPPPAASGPGDGGRHGEGSGSGGEDGDDDDEAPQIVVLKEGKHLSGRDVENERRKARGLSPLPDPSALSAAAASNPKSATEKKPNSKDAKPSLSFSSAGAKSTKRKLGLLSSHDTDRDRQDDLDGLVRREKDAKVGKQAISSSKAGKVVRNGKDGKSSKKKAKTGALLSFADDG